MFSYNEKRVALSKFIQNNQSKIILFITQGINALLGVALGKLIATNISPAEFGNYNLQFATYTFFFSLFLSPFLQYMKVYTNSNLNTEGHRNAITTLYILTLFCSAFLFIVSIFKFQINIWSFLILFFCLIFNILFNLYSDYFNIKGLLNLFSISNLLKSVFSLGVLFLLLYTNPFDFDSVNILWIVQLIGFLFGIVFFLPKYKLVWNVTNKKSYKDFFVKYWIYAWPLIILSFWAWINNYFDRYIIEYFLDSRSVGIYNASLGLGSKIFTILNPIILALMIPVVFSNDANIFEKKKATRKYAVLYTLISLIILIIIYLSYNHIGRILLSMEYSEGFYLIFWTAAIYFVITLTYIFEQILYATNKTKIILYSNIFSAILSIIINIFAVINFGLVGVMFGLITASISRLLYVLYHYKKLNDENCDYR